MAKKLKKLKKVAKVAVPVLGAMALAKGLGKRGLKGRADKLTEGDIGINQRAPRVDDYNYIPKKIAPVVGDTMWDSPWGAKEGGRAKRGVGIAKRGFGRALKGK